VIRLRVAYPWTCVALVVALAAVTGCRAPAKLASAPKWSAEKLNPLTWGADDEDAQFGAPERIVATWTDSVLQQPGKAAERGFGGRVYFYDKQGLPIAVEGRLVVYAFDEVGRLPTDHRPTRRYVFLPEELALRRSPSELGTSYSVWLPWDAVGGAAADVSLIARFEPLQGGGLLVSDQARQQLPGTELDPAAPIQLARSPERARSPEGARSLEGGGGVRPASYADASGAVNKQALQEPAQPEERRRLATTTIRRPQR
jgi:hypothetical protein